MTRRWIFFLYILPAILLLAGSIVFWVTDLDLRLALRYFDSGAKSWPYANDEPWATLYKLGVIPALATTVLAFSLLMLSIGRPRLARYRKINAFLLLALVLGPGLVANAILKDNWGRPRPREVVELGGRDKFEPLLTIDRSSDGKSFVCGHATMGYYFFSAGLVFFAFGRRKTGVAVVLGAAVFGTLIGMARVIQGGHFASDVLWAAGVIWFVSAGLFHAFRLHRNVLYEPAKPVGTNVPRWVPVATLTGLLVIIGTTSLAFPYSRTKKTTLVSEEIEHLPDTVILDLDLEGSVELTRGDELLLETESRGFGFPKSRLSNDRIFIENGAEVKHRRRGHFTELVAHTRIILPPDRIYRISLGKRVKEVWVIPPKEFDSDNFAYIFLTHGFSTKLMNLKADPIEEDNYGRKTRGFKL